MRRGHRGHKLAHLHRDTRGRDRSSCADTITFIVMAIGLCIDLVSSTDLPLHQLECLLFCRGKGRGGRGQCIAIHHRAIEGREGRGAVYIYYHIMIEGLLRGQGEDASMCQGLLCGMGEDRSQCGGEGDERIRGRIHRIGDIGECMTTMTRGHDGKARVIQCFLCTNNKEKEEEEEGQ